MKDSALILELLHPALHIKKHSDNNQRGILDCWIAVPITVEPCEAISNYASQNLRLWSNSKEDFKTAINDAVKIQFANDHCPVEIIDNQVDPYSSQCEITLKDKSGNEAIFIFELKTVDEGLTL
ncbi:hypothetical protein GLP21_12605 [Photobacterium carnosum]|uniref:Uncharacterized protein n=1 Tax=Photobacterium carnosum TaxID=2023717 RepID=A0A2N4UWC5_9GAMM|nr:MULTISPECIES: hypothetical protein [Photobacterium]MCD9477231.1 hypothetical protein [Photobacterium phosphoreum]MCD9485956.1 hypothetical protein [Photobacterium iliopiscarium]MCD9508782.1 hypothetical protein [Photobacterium phosphoreum]MCD9539315.1 hypothetical protein [Photobacterium carnosum]MCD9543034.1 hypothetical protein [Photobacterium carnosum]